MKHDTLFILLFLCSFLQHIYVLTVLPTLLHFMQTKGTSYRAEMLHYLMFHPMNQQKDLSQWLDKF
jgi:hypothetical protein